MGAQDRLSPTFSAISETSLRAMAKAMKAMRAAKAMKAMKRVSKFAKVREVRCVPRDEDSDHRWADQGQPDEEQEREDREQEGERERQEGLRPDQGLDRRRAEGAQGSRREGLLRGEE